MTKEELLDLDDEDLIRLMALGRTVIGGSLMLFPRLAVRVWTGDEISHTSSYLSARGLGARDLALGLGTLIALEEKRDVSSWLRAGALVDLSDGVSALTTRGLPPIRRIVSILTAGASVMLGWRLSESSSGRQRQ